jgi:hypothetical protein
VGAERNGLLLVLADWCLSAMWDGGEGTGGVVVLVVVVLLLLVVVVAVMVAAISVSDQWQRWQWFRRGRVVVDGGRLSSLAKREKSGCRFEEAAALQKLD